MSLLGEGYEDKGMYETEVRIMVKLCTRWAQPSSAILGSTPTLVKVHLLTEPHQPFLAELGQLRAACHRKYPNNRPATVVSCNVPTAVITLHSIILLLTVLFLRTWLRVPEPRQFSTRLANDQMYLLPQIPCFCKRHCFRSAIQ